MPDQPRKKNRLLHELKRRNVLRVIAMYAGAAFVIIELINNITDPLALPAWTPTIVILLLIIGFPIVGILSWIFDLTPEGFKKTDSIPEKDDEELLSEANRRRLKISDIIIAILVVVVGVLVYPKIFNKDTFKGVRDSDGKIAIAVLPFENLSGDSIYNIWQGGFQNLLINTLSNSNELSVRRYQAVNDVLNNKKDISIATLSPSMALDLASKLEARTMILGNILKSGKMIRINAQLVDAETEEIYKTYQVDGESENDLFILADSLAVMIKNYIEIKHISDQYNAYEIQGNSLTNSSEAFKNYIRGWNAFKYSELHSAIDWFTKAIEEDSSFALAYIYGAYANLMYGRDQGAKNLSRIVYEKMDELALEEKLMVQQLNAYFFETPHEEIQYLKQLIEIDPLDPRFWHTMGFAYFKLFEYEDAVRCWEQLFSIHEKWGTDYQNPYVYFLLGNAYHKLGEHEKEEKILALGNKIYPNAIMIQQHQAICAFTLGDLKKAENILIDYKSIRQNVLHCSEAMISSGVGTIYSSSGLMEEAEAYYREATQLEPDNLYWAHEFARFLIVNDIDIMEGLKITEQILEQNPQHWGSLDIKGWGLYKLGKPEEALNLLKESWHLKPAYVHEGFLHIEEIEGSLSKQQGAL